VASTHQLGMHVSTADTHSNTAATVNSATVATEPGEVNRHKYKIENRKNRYKNDITYHHNAQMSM